jgi:hypothetical protein
MNHPHPDANCRFASAAYQSATTDHGSTALPPTTTRVYGAVEDPTPNQWGINAYALWADA